MDKKLDTSCRFAVSLMTGLLLFSGANSYADDTEIFFGGPAIDSGIRPNVLFVLDNSGSMNWRLNSNNTATGSQKSRMDVLKESFQDIMSHTRDINVGVMVLNGRSEYGDSRFVYPVTYIDQALPGNADLVATTPGIRATTDDATQGSVNRSAVTTDPTLVMGTISSLQDIEGSAGTSVLGTTGSFFRVTSGSTQYACRLSPPSRNSPLRCTNGTMSELNMRVDRDEALFNFQDLNVPGNATISEAYIELTPTNTPESTSNNRRNPRINVQMERNKSPAALNDNNPIGSRTYLSTDNPRAFGWISGERVRIDVTDLIEQLRTGTPASNPTNSPINGVLVRLSGNSSNNSSQNYTFCANNCSQGNAPTLVIRYTNPGYAPEQRMGALRFQDVGIPQGATITDARINFVPAATSTTLPTLEVRAERVGNASSFTAGENLTGRSPTTALTTWTPTTWPLQATPAPIQGPDVTTQVQEVVGLSSWCGNNAMAFYLTPTSTEGVIAASSFDGAGGLQPTLTVSYTGGTGGCFNSIVEARITDEKNDGHQNNSGSVTLGAQTLPMTTREIGARFDNLPINPGAEIMEAKVLITPAATVNTPTQTSLISFQNSSNPTVFTAGNNNFSNRDNRTSSAQCQINSTTGWVEGQPVTCDISGLTSSLTSIFSVSNSWTRGNALNMFIRHSSTSSLTATAYETNPSQSIKLRLKIRNGGLSNTVRSHVNALVQNMYAEDNTPIVPTLYDAARYLRGSISSRPTPINSTCQANHVVLLTDGQANNNTTSAVNGITSIINKSSCDSAESGELCARDLAKFLAENDQSNGIEGSNTITTHTVGFALDASGTTASANIRRFLAEVATNGGGGTYSAETASELSSAFNRIIQEVLATDTTFVSPGATVNQFNRQTNRNEIYFALFKPSETDRWIGNLKRYKLTNTAGSEVMDADNVAAIDPLTGFFKSTARSFWTASADGANTALGGVANNLPANASRKLFTYIGASPASGAVPLNTDAHRLDTANNNLTEALLGASDTTQRSQLINWIRGTNTDNTARNGVGDPLHSVPRLLTYKCNTFSNTELTACSDEDQTAFVGTNEGLVHAFNTSNGEEQFAFMPQELLPNIKPLMVNAKSTSVKPRIYGMDNSVVVWANDANGNGVVYGGRDPSSTDTPRLLTGLNPGEFVYAYATMGRGGRNLYALDVTDRDAPKMLWYIKGGETSGFEQLGQTWSTPVLTTINVNGISTKVLIFAGGYDKNQDNVKAKTADGMGNALYIVNATTGALIWSASGAATGHTLRLNKMLYSMPAPVRVIDIDRDGKADQFFVGDMGGQIWRFFINNGSAASSLVSPVNSNGSGAPDSNDGVFADLIAADAGNETATQLEQKLRRFYNEPDVALLNINGTRTLTVNIGSGYRGHPLNTVTQDRFYSFRTPLVYNPTTDGANNHTTLTESDMYDATDNLVQEGNDTQQQSASTAFTRTSGGWYIRLTNSGEKVLSDSATFAGLLVFTTYEPTASLNSCRAAQGISRAYTVSLFDATPPAENVTGTPDKTDRVTLLKTSGIPPKPVFLLPDNGSGGGLGGGGSGGSGGGSGNGPWVLCIGTVCKTIKGPYQESTYWIDDN